MARMQKLLYGQHRQIYVADGDAVKQVWNFRTQACMHGELSFFKVTQTVHRVFIRKDIMRCRPQPSSPWGNERYYLLRSLSRDTPFQRQPINMKALYFR